MAIFSTDVRLEAAYQKEFQVIKKNKGKNNNHMKKNTTKIFR